MSWRWRHLGAQAPRPEGAGSPGQLDLEEQCWGHTRTERDSKGPTCAVLPAALRRPCFAALAGTQRQRLLLQSLDKVGRRDARGGPRPACCCLLWTHCHCNRRHTAQGGPLSLLLLLQSPARKVLHSCFSLAPFPVSHTPVQLGDCSPQGLDAVCWAAIIES